VSLSTKQRAAIASKTSRTTTRKTQALVLLPMVHQAHHHQVADAVTARATHLPHRHAAAGAP